MAQAESVLYEGDTAYGHYSVVDMTYQGRPARVLFSGSRIAAQSGVARDNRPELLFDYNQRFLELIEIAEVRKLLLIGGGAYTLPMALLKQFPHVTIDVVEIDPGLDDIARRFFGLTADARLRILHTSGRDYLNTATAVYDLILVDAFTHTAIPRSLITLQATEHMHRLLSPHGIVAANIIAAPYGPTAEILRHQCAAYKKVFKNAEAFPAGHDTPSSIPQNLLVLAQKNGGEPLQHYMRYQAIELPTYSDEDLLHDGAGT